MRRSWRFCGLRLLVRAGSCGGDRREVRACAKTRATRTREDARYAIRWRRGLSGGAVAARCSTNGPVHYPALTALRKPRPLARVPDPSVIAAEDWIEERARGLRDVL